MKMMTCIKIVLEFHRGISALENTEQRQLVVWLVVDTHTKLICVFYMHIPNYTYILNMHVKYS